MRMETEVMEDRMSKVNSGDSFTMGPIVFH